MPLIWTEFTADIIEYRVREVTNGERFSVTLFTPSHLERLSERDWMNLESHGFPVHLYAERARAGNDLDPKGSTAIAEELVAEVHAVDEVPTEELPPSPALEGQQAEKARESKDALKQLADQIPQPFHVQAGAAETSLQRFALMTRDFNQAMSLPEGSVLRCVSVDRGQEYGGMLRQEIQEVEEAIASGILHDILAELIDVIYLTLNLGQECGLEPWLDDAFVLNHNDNMRKQHESVTHLSWTRTAHAKACKCSEETLKFTVSRTGSGKWLLYSGGKLIKPYDYVPSDYSKLLMREPQGKQDMGSEIPERTSQPLHTSGRESSQYTFAHIGIQAAMCDNLPKGASKTSMMWLSNVVGEYLTKLDQKPEVAPVHLPRLIDDPASTLEQTVMDLQVAHEAKDAAGCI